MGLDMGGWPCTPVPRRGLEPLPTGPQEQVPSWGETECGSSLSSLLLQTRMGSWSGTPEGSSEPLEKGAPNPPLNLQEILVS